MISYYSSEYNTESRSCYRTVGGGMIASEKSHGWEGHAGLPGVTDAFARKIGHDTHAAVQQYPFS